MIPNDQPNATVAKVGESAADLWRASESLCRAMAGRDLGEAPLYIVPQSYLPPECGAADHCYGYTAPSLDLYLADHIPGYRGRGPCMVINDVAIKEDHHPDDVSYLTKTFVLHELAHILDRPEPIAARANSDPMRIKFDALVVADAVQRPVRNDIPAYFGHGLDFIRIALHLNHRANTLGMSVASNILCAGYRYGLSPAWRYAEVLGDEPARLHQMPFREIRLLAPPPAFSCLWHEDLHAYHQRFLLQKGRPT